jgi:hypothetical protein
MMMMMMCIVHAHIRPTCVSSRACVHVPYLDCVLLSIDTTSEKEHSHSVRVDDGKEIKMNVWFVVVCVRS